MEVDETKLPASSRTVLEILREEMKIGRLTEEQAELVRDALVLKNSWGILSGFVIKTAALLAAFGGIYAAFKLFMGTGK